MGSTVDLRKGVRVAKTLASLRSIASGCALALWFRREPFDRFRLAHPWVGMMHGTWRGHASQI